MIDLKVTKMADQPDGSLVIEFEMDEYTLHFLAKIGMQHLIETAAGKVLDGYSDPEGDGDTASRERSDSDLFGEIPGL